MFNFNKNFLDKIIKRDKEKTEVPAGTPEFRDAKKSWVDITPQDTLDNKEQYETKQIERIKNLEKEIKALIDEKKKVGEDYDLDDFGGLHQKLLLMMQEKIKQINDQIDEKEKELDEIGASIGNN